MATPAPPGRRVRSRTARHAASPARVTTGIVAVLRALAITLALATGSALRRMGTPPVPRRLTGAARTVGSAVRQIWTPPVARRLPGARVPDVAITFASTVRRVCAPRLPRRRHLRVPHAAGPAYRRRTGATRRPLRAVPLAMALLATVAVALAAMSPAAAADRAHAHRATRNRPAAPQAPAAPVRERGVASHKVTGVDVSKWQGDGIDWGRVAGGTRFAYVKATEGTGYVSRTFASQYAGARSHGMYAGAYAFGRPDAPAVPQADFFLRTAGYQRDGRTLPPMLDIEWPYPVSVLHPGSTAGGFVAPYPCYGLRPAAMVSWIRAFVDEVARRTGSKTMIYTASGWWNECTGGSSAFADQPLFAASYNRAAPHLPAGWTQWTIWQYSSQGSMPGDQDVFHGTEGDLRSLVDNASVLPLAGGRLSLLPATRPGDSGRHHSTDPADAGDTGGRHDSHDPGHPGRRGDSGRTYGSNNLRYSGRSGGTGFSDGTSFSGDSGRPRFAGDRATGRTAGWNPDWTAGRSAGWPGAGRATARTAGEH